LGGVHKYDLTPDCTHLIVGEYDTPKYRHVAKERPDIRVMAAGWVEAVRNLWIQDAEIDFLALEKAWQLRPFEIGGGEPTPDGSVAPRRKLLCCMTGFEDPDIRQEIVDMIESNGGQYIGDLTKRVTHLIVYKPEGRKYQAAKNWGIHTVSLEWLRDSIERGLILDEKLYDPLLPPAERGVGAWNRQKRRISLLGKRLREQSSAQNEGKRKLRKTASMKLSSQRDNLWEDILGKPSASATGFAIEPQQQKALTTPAPDGQTAPIQHASAGRKAAETQGSNLTSLGVSDDGGIFAACCFYVHGFSSQKTEILVHTIASLGGLICHSLDEVISMSGAQMTHRFLIVPQTSAPDTHPHVPETVHVITEFYIEKCLHRKYFFDPSQHVIGRPFPRFPIPGFEELSISTSGFTGVDLNHINKTICQLGATYEERFTASVSLLICPSLAAARKAKVDMAVAWKVPVVSADWLWESICTGYKAPIKQFMFPELKQDISSPKRMTTRYKTAKETPQGKDTTFSTRRTTNIDEDLLPKHDVKLKRPFAPDKTAFVPVDKQDSEPQAGKRPSSAQRNDLETSTTTHFETAATHLASEDATISFKTKTLPSGAPLLEKTSSSLNTSLSPQNQVIPRPRKHLMRTSSEVADSEATESDIGRPDDIQFPENLASKDGSRDPPNPPDALNPDHDPEVLEKRIQEEKAAQEHLAISNKLVTSLLDTTSKLDTGETATAPTTPAAPATNGPSALGSFLENNNSSISNATADEIRAKRRKRDIFGRAISNVSIASSTSGDAPLTPTTTMTNVATSNNKPHRLTSAPATSLAGDDGATAACDNAKTSARPENKNGKDPTLPSSTQLEYEDPEARRYKAELLSKMLGGKNGAVAYIEEDPRPQEKLTLASMGGYDTFAESGRGGPMRRSTRRKS